MSANLGCRHGILISQDCVQCSRFHQQPPATSAAGERTPYTEEEIEMNKLIRAEAQPAPSPKQTDVSAKCDCIDCQLEVTAATPSLPIPEHPPVIAQDGASEWAEEVATMFDRFAAKARLDEARDAYYTWKNSHEDFGAVQAKRIAELEAKLAK